MFRRGLVGRLSGRGHRNGLLIVLGGGFVGVTVVVVCLGESLGGVVRVSRLRVRFGLIVGAAAPL
jgi:hypothetical protein